LHTFFSRAQSYKTFLGATKLRKGKFNNPSGVDVMATIFCDFLPIFVEKMAFFSKRLRKCYDQNLSKTSCGLCKKRQFFRQLVLPKIF
jgi:hypothetical protein